MTGAWFPLRRPDREHPERVPAVVRRPVLPNPVDTEVRTTRISNPIVGEDWDVEFTVAARGPARPVIWPPNQSNDNSEES